MKKHFGDTVLGNGLAIAAVVLSVLLGIGGCVAIGGGCYLKSEPTAEKATK